MAKMEEKVVIEVANNNTKAPIPAPRIAGLFVLFFLIAFGLGYPTLNRYDPRQVPGLADVKSYSAMVAGEPFVGQPHVRFRVLVPWIARPFYYLVRGRSGSWDPVMFGLLAANSLLVATTAILIVILGTGEVGYAAGLVAALIYLLNFAVPNLRLVGLVDAGEGLFLLALLWSLSSGSFWTLTAIAALGTLTKESFVPFGIVFTATWWIASLKKQRSPLRNALWILASWIVSSATMIVLHRVITGAFQNPLTFVARGHSHYLDQLSDSLFDRNLLYIFVWLLPLGLPRILRFRKSWLIPAASACVAAFVLDAYYSGDFGTVGRALFSIAGPLLSLSAATLLLDGARAG